MFKSAMRELTKILPPPKKPLDYDEDALHVNHGIFQFDFPEDFLEFGRTYGSGEIKCAYSWEVWSPCRRLYPFLVLDFAVVMNACKDEIEDPPFAIFPERGGIFPFAFTANGDYVCWLTEGYPDDWPIVDIKDFGEGQYEVLKMNFSQYFVKVLTQKLVLKRHKKGKTWVPEDVRFNQEVFKDMEFKLPNPQWV